MNILVKLRATRLELEIRRILSTPQREALGILKAALFPDVKGPGLQLTRSPDGTRILAMRCKNS